MAYTAVVRYESVPRAEPRPITPRRLQASARALRREQESHPLFAKQIAEEQPTPEERLVQIEAGQVAHWQRIRDFTAQTWRAARRILHSLPDDQQAILIEEWNNAPFPAGAAYFADFMRRKMRNRVFSGILPPVHSPSPEASHEAYRQSEAS